MNVSLWCKIAYALTAGGCWMAAQSSECNDWLGKDDPGIVCELSMIIESSYPAGKGASCMIPGFDAR